jgi:hypothetical protein
MNIKILEMKNSWRCFVCSCTDAHKIKEGFIEVFLSRYVDQSFIFLFYMYALLYFYAVSNGVARFLGTRLELSPLPSLEECINSKEFTVIFLISLYSAQ